MSNDVHQLLGDFLDKVAPETQQPTANHSAEEYRLIAGFAEIQQFVATHGRIPQHGEEHDIFERLYAQRLERLQGNANYRALLTPFDHQQLLTQSTAQAPVDDATLLDELATLSEGEEDITVLRHVRATAIKRQIEETANREPCTDFAQFSPLFAQIKAEIHAGIRRTARFGVEAGINVDIERGDYFILNGQIVYVAEVGEVFKGSNGGPDARLRVIYDNGTESNLLMRSLQRALYKDEAGRRIGEPDCGPLFADEWDIKDKESGTIYVLRSLSDEPFIRAHRELIHKIGVTGGDVKKRIANAAKDPTYLLAEVEIIAQYKLVNIHRQKLEKLLHRIFAPAQLNIALPDRFNQTVNPREWFLVPLFVIDKAIAHIRDGTISNLIYNPDHATLEPISPQKAQP